MERLYTGNTRDSYLPAQSLRSKSVGAQPRDGGATAAEIMEVEERLAEPAATSVNPWALGLAFPSAALCGTEGSRGFRVGWHKRSTSNVQRPTFNSGKFQPLDVMSKDESLACAREQTPSTNRRGRSNLRAREEQTAVNGRAPQAFARARTRRRREWISSPPKQSIATEPGSGTVDSSTLSRYPLCHAEPVVPPAIKR